VEKSPDSSPFNFKKLIKIKGNFKKRVHTEFKAKPKDARLWRLSRNANHVILALASQSRPQCGQSILKNTIGPSLYLSALSLHKKIKKLGE